MLFTKDVSLFVTESGTCGWSRNVMKCGNVKYKKRLFIELGCFYSECETNRTKGETHNNIATSETLHSGRIRPHASPKNY
jgi:hypothetical protein